jgi:two-component system sensor histidine kinase KdpD
MTTTTLAWRELPDLRISLRQPLRNWIISFLILIVTCIAAVALKPASAGEISSGLTFVLGITLVGATSGLGPALWCALVASAIFNFFLNEPVLTFSLSSGEDFTPPIIFTLCAIVSGVLSGRLKDQSSRTANINFRLESLLDASRDLQRATSEAEVHEALKSTLSDKLHIEFAMFRESSSGPAAIAEGRLSPRWFRTAERLFAEKAEFIQEQELSGYLLSGSQGVVGAFVSDESGIPLMDRNFMLGLARVAGLALERAQLAARIAEAQARARTEELKSALLSSVSHDIRTPLTAISASASSLLTFEGQFDPATSRRLLEGIVEECSRMNHLAANLLEMTRLQGGIENMRRSVLPAGEITRNAVLRQRRFVDSQRAVFVAPQKEIFVEADTALFELALANVLQNAFLYSEDEVTVVCEVVDGRCRIAVSDRGIGIPEGEQLRVFERFHRLERGGSAPKGTGLGLAIAKGFVEASNGTIAIESPIFESRGTRVVISLPLVGLGDAA